MTRAIALLVAALALAGCGVDADVSRTLGARCDSADECDDRCLAPGAAFPGGFCSVSCESNADCPVEASCADAESGVCLFECADNGECEFLGPGWACFARALREDAARQVLVCIGG